jgi:hypothetical protein
LPARKFDMRDHFILDRHDLSPDRLRQSARRGGACSSVLRRRSGNRDAAGQGCADSD